jgi:RNA polymerase sigma factor (sigma-70 family)
MPVKHVKARREDRDYEDLVRLYLEDVGRHDLLTKDDEIRLAQAIEAGVQARAQMETAKKLTPTQRRQLRRAIRHGEEAHRQFVNSNLRLVVSIAKKYQSSGLPLLDIVQEGNLGLIHAVDKFDWRKGFKFSTYATWWIRQAIQRGIANSARVIRLPVHAGDMLTALLKLRAQLEGSLGRTPTLAELASEAELPLEKVVEVLRYAVDTVSLDEPVRDDGDAELGDFVEDRNAVAPFDHAATSLLPGEVAKVLSVLDERERTILTLRFGLDGGGERTLEELVRGRSGGTRPPTSAPASYSKPSEFRVGTFRPAALRGGRFASLALHRIFLFHYSP